MSFPVHLLQQRFSRGQALPWAVPCLKFATLGRGPLLTLGAGQSRLQGLSKPPFLHWLFPCLWKPELVYSLKSPQGLPPTFVVQRGFLPLWGRRTARRPRERPPATGRPRVSHGGPVPGLRGPGRALSVPGRRSASSAPRGLPEGVRSQAPNALAHLAASLWPWKRVPSAAPIACLLLLQFLASWGTEDSGSG